jgi:hypothetical protein
MVPAQFISMAGVRDKTVSWRCADDCIEATTVHPVQMVHLHLGQEETDGARRTRLIHMEMAGAELMLFREVIPAAATGDERHG